MISKALTNEMQSRDGLVTVRCEIADALGQCATMCEWPMVPNSSSHAGRFRT
jgi:hypothetical protein